MCQVLCHYGRQTDGIRVPVPDSPSVVSWSCKRFKLRIRVVIEGFTGARSTHQRFYIL